MDAAKILIVDDEKFVRRTISRVLSSEGFATFEASNGPDALRMAQEQSFDLMLLDIVMDGMDGFQVIRTLRDLGILLPVFVLSGRQADNDKILALGIGADDYITKPFSTTVLCAKVKACLRRANEYARSVPERENEAGQTQIRIGDLLIDPGNLTVQKRGEGISLTAKEFDILRLLAGNPSRVYTKIQIYESVWDENFLKDENVINVTIRRLREKIEDNPSAPVYIKTVWGIGYKMGTGEAE